MNKYIFLKRPQDFCDFRPCTIPEISQKQFCTIFATTNTKCMVKRFEKHFFTQVVEPNKKKPNRDYESWFATGLIFRDIWKGGLWTVFTKNIHEKMYACLVTISYHYHLHKPKSKKNTQYAISYFGIIIPNKEMGTKSAKTDP